LPHRPCRQRAQGGRREAADLLPLLAREEEQLVLLDRAAQAPAEVVVAQASLVDPAGIAEEVVPVQAVVAVVFVRAPLEVIAPTAGDDVDVGAGRGPASAPARGPPPARSRPRRCLRSPRGPTPRPPR